MFLKRKGREGQLEEGETCNQMNQGWAHVMLKGLELLDLLGINAVFMKTKGLLLCFVCSIYSYVFLCALYC